MAVDTQSGVPCKFRSGDTVRFSYINSDHPASSWSAQFCLSRNGTAVSPVSATESGDEYIFTLSAATTAALSAGTYKWMIRYTETSSSEVETGEQGILDVLPNLATSQSASTAQALLTLCEAQLTALLASGDTFASVSFNGQSYSKRDIGQLMAQRDRLRAEVISERRAAALAAGENDGTVFQVRFRGPGGAPFGPNYGCR